jgi:hypothetical protein
MARYKYLDRLSQGLILTLNLAEPHGYIQGYKGIAVVDSANQVIISAEAFGSGSETEHFPAMLDSLKETMKELTGEEKPLAHAVLTGDIGTLRRTPG